MSRALAIVTFLWGTRYGPEYVNRLYAGLRRHTSRPFQFYCVQDRVHPELHKEIRPLPLWEEHAELGRCYRRLRMYGADIVNFIPADRIIMIDLDTVITSDMTPLLDIDAPFAIWRARSVGPQGYCLNPSFVSMVPGVLDSVYRLFKLDPGRTIGYAQHAGWTGSDQAILSHYVTPSWASLRTLDYRDGLYSFRDDACTTPLPSNARLISFYGTDDMQYNHVQNAAPWIKEHWV